MFSIWVISIVIDLLRKEDKLLSWRESDNTTTGVCVEETFVTPEDTGPIAI